MSKPTPITIPTEQIGSIPSPVDLLNRVAKGHSEDANLAPRYEHAIRDTMERFDSKPRASGCFERRTAEVSQFLHVLCAWASKHGPGWFQNSVLRRLFAPPVAAHTRPFTLQAVRRLTFVLGNNWRRS